MEKNIDDYKLCFVRTLDGDNAHVLYFTPFDATNITGDDWDNAPYEHNASEPYYARLGSYKDIHSKKETAVVAEDIGDKLVEVIIYSYDTAALASPCSYVLNSDYSVKDINEGMTPWIVAKWFENGVAREEVIMANATYKEVVEKLDGFVYLPKARKNLTADEFLGSNWREDLENIEDGWD